MTDSFSYLLDAGWPLERLQWYMRTGVGLAHVETAVKDMLARGMTMEEIIRADSGESDAPPPEDKPPPTLDTITAADLQKKEIPPIRFIVNKLLTVGLNILASPPKYGKSWMVLSLCLAVSTGSRFLGYDTARCECLYLALEDSQRRLKSRMNKLLSGKGAPAGFHFATTAHSMDEGLFDQLEGFLKTHQDTG